MGPAMALLLDRVGEHGSIRKAAASLGMGYRNAWGLIQALQEAFNAEIVSTATGGNAGGGTKLTSAGAELLAAYRRIEIKAADAVRTDMESLRTLARDRRPGSASRRRPMPMRP